MALTLEQACTPRQSVFDPNIHDTVFNIDELTTIDPERFFSENYLNRWDENASRRGVQAA